ncbi:MAG: ABC transporter permease [Actinomycetota bacterium]|nr:ABC transporter permease [Actinomycetota bacterium]
MLEAEAVVLVEPEAEPGPARPTRSRRAGLIRFAWQMLLLAVFLVTWQMLVDHKVLTELSVSKPTAIWDEMVKLYRGGQIWNNVGVTLQETVVGYVFGVVAGVAAGFTLAFTPRLLAVLNPFITILNSLPRFALGPLFILWFGIGLTSKVALVFSLVVFIVFTNTSAGARSVDADVVTVSRLLGASRWDIIRKVMLPSTFPWVVAGMRLSIAYAVAGAVVGEMFASQEGIGNWIVAGSGVFNTAEIFAGLLVIAVIAGTIDLLGRLVERRVLRWRPEVAMG